MLVVVAMVTVECILLLFLIVVVTTVVTTKKVTTFRDVTGVPESLMELRDVVATISNPSILFQQQDGYNHNNSQQ